MKKHFLVGVLCVLTSSLFAQVSSDRTYKFLNLPTSARSAAMGGSFISSGKHDLNLVADNPSVLNESMDGHLTMTYLNYISDVNMGYLAYAKNFEKAGIFSLGLQFLGYGDIIRADETGQQMGTFSAGDYAMDISYGTKMSDQIDFGASMKFIYSSYDYLNSFGIAFDLGATYKSKSELFTAGAVINNIGTEIKPYFKGDAQKLPLKVQLAGSLKLAKAPLRFTILANNLQTWDLVGNTAVEGVPTIGSTGNSVAQSNTGSFGDNLFRHLVFGAEILPNDNFFINIAYNYLRKAELGIPNRTSLNAFSFGFGFKMKRLKFSYALASYTTKGTSNHFTLTTDLNSFKKKVKN